MKAFILAILIVAFTGTPVPKQDTAKNIPPYRLLTKDSVYITPANLKKNKPVMIIYFSPDCSHCQRLTFEMKEEFTKEAKHDVTTLKHVQIIMATWTQLKSIQVFYNDFGLDKYPNIIVGTEGYTYQLQKFYQVKTTPYIAIYSKTGKLVKAFDKIPSMEDIVAELSKV